jgi:hypothetical protein
MDTNKEFTLEQRVTTKTFGDGSITEISGDVITVKFDDGETRKMKAEYLTPWETLDQLRAQFHDAWIRGTAWRLEVGQLLYKIKKQCAHGEWKAFLDQYELARSTADDYVRRYEDEAQITGPRQFDTPNPAPDPDPEADERTEQIAEEQEKRKGRKPTHHPTEVHVRVKDLSATDLEFYYAEKKENPERVKKIWSDAFKAIIADRLKAEDEVEEVPDFVSSLEGAATPTQPEGGDPCTA